MASMMRVTNGGMAGAGFVFWVIITPNTEPEPGGEFAETGDGFGDSVALSGNTLAVSAVLEDSAATGVNGDESSSGGFDSGAVYVFTRGGDGAWSQQAFSLDLCKEAIARCMPKMC